MTRYFCVAEGFSRCCAAVFNMRFKIIKTEPQLLAKWHTHCDFVNRRALAPGLNSRATMHFLSAIAIDHLFSNGHSKQKGVPEIFVLTRLFSFLFQVLSRLSFRLSEKRQHALRALIGDSQHTRTGLNQDLSTCQIG